MGKRKVRAADQVVAVIQWITSQGFRACVLPSWGSGDSMRVSVQLDAWPLGEGGPLPAGEVTIWVRGPWETGVISASGVGVDALRAIKHPEADDAARYDGTPAAEVVQRYAQRDAVREYREAYSAAMAANASSEALLAISERAREHFALIRREVRS